MPVGIPKNGINKGWFKKGIKLSKKKIEKMKGRIPWNKGITGIFKHSNETKEKMRNTHKKIGYKHSKKIKNKISIANKGHQFFGEKNSSWKGNNVGYCGLHKWVQKHLGKPSKCKHCGKDELSGRQVDWANKDHKYKRNLIDWIRLCKSCHRKYDIKKKTI